MTKSPSGRARTRPTTLEEPELAAIPDERFHRVTRLARHAVGARMAAVSFVRHGQPWLAAGAEGTGGSPSLLAALWARTILEDDGLVVPDVRADPRFTPYAASSNGAVDLTTADIRFFVGLPLAGPSGTKVGVLWVADEKPRTELDPLELEPLRDLVAIVEQELTIVRLATMDELTGLANRRGLITVGRHVLATSQRLHRPAALLYVDVDGLKQINDTRGHAVGDRTIRATADILTESLRAADVIARVGGDEFCVLLSDTPPEVIPMLVARIRGRLDELNEHPDREFDLSFSEGWVAYDADESESIEALMERGDQKMYEQKQAKRRDDET